MEDQVISGVNQEAAAPQSNESMEAQSGQQQEQMVPLSALQSERAQRQSKEEEAKLLRENFALLQANIIQSQQQKPKNELEELADTDVLTVGEAKKFMSQFTQQHHATLEELKMSQKYSDYQDVVSKYLPEVLKTNPSIYETLKASQDYELAYYLAKNSESYRTDKHKKNVSADAERILQNSQKTASLSSIGSISPMSNSKRYKEMSDEEFIKEVQKNLGNA